MTKDDPEKLCKSCKEFDYIMNRRGGVSSDIYVVCEHDEEEISLYEKELITAKEAYRQIVQVITELEDKFDVTFELPGWIEINGRRFYKSQLHIFA